MRNLIIRTIKNNKSDYTLYFFTLVLIVSIIYAFSGLAFSEDLMNISDNMSILKSSISILILLTVYFSSVVISNATRFMFLQRSKEFATYILLGVKRSAIIKILMLENLMIILASTVVGCFLGAIMVRFFSDFINIIFDRKIVELNLFSIDVFALTVVTVFIIGLLSMINSATKISREKVVNLLYLEKQSENIIDIGRRRGIFELIFALISIVFSIFAFRLVLQTSTNSAFIYIFSVILFLIIGIYLIQKNLSTIIFEFSTRKSDSVYKSKTLYFIKDLKSKFSIKRKMTAIICVMSTIAMLSLTIAIIFGAGYKESIKHEYPYDITIGIDAHIEDYKDVKAFIDEKYTIYDSVSFYLYDLGDGYVAIKLSDYNKIRDLLGYKRVNVSKNKYLIHSENNLNISDLGDKLISSELKWDKNVVLSEPMEAYRTIGTNGVVFIMDDSFFSGLKPDKSRMVLSVKEEVDVHYKDELRRYITKDWKPVILEEKSNHITMNINTKSWGMNNSLGGFLIILFVGLYLCMIFIIYSATIIGFENLSKLFHVKKEYNILFNLGFGTEDIRRTIDKSLFVFFYSPLALPTIVAGIIMISLKNMFDLMNISVNLVITAFAVSISMFLLIYTLFFLIVRYLYNKEIFHNY